MKWEHLDLGAGTWSKPPTSTKQDRYHSVPLSAPARALLAEIEKQTGTGKFVFPSDSRTGHVVNIGRAWRRLLKAAGVTGLRIHDLRHSYASKLVSAGHSLPLIGALLGHSSVAMTERYAHLENDPLRRATEQVGAIVTAAAGEQPATEPTLIRRRGRP
jgi:integrase